MRKADKEMRTNQPLISTGLQPGVGGRRVTLAVSTASRAREKPLKRLDVLLAGGSPGSSLVLMR
jgi:hypothetical protein